MNNKKLLSSADRLGFVLGPALLVTLSGCIGYVDRPPAVYMQPPPVETRVVMQDDYVYYPGYDVYYISNRRQYAYLEGGAWVSRPAPRGVSVDVLMASPSVRMEFHDSPAYHHAATVQKYPRNWAPPGPNQGRQQDQHDDRHDEGKGNNGR